MIKKEKWNLAWDILVYLFVLHMLAATGLEGQDYFVRFYFSIGALMCIIGTIAMFMCKLKRKVLWKIFVLWPYLFVPSETNEAMWVKNWVSHDIGLFIR
jgi:hypothetical protein